jgi:alpha-beta hydrolase superfamily lysophospholipase
MPGAGTHTTIIQHLADLAQSNPDPDFKKFLTDPNLNAQDWATYACPDALQSRYAVLGAMGPDIFYLMLDYGGGQQQLEDLAVKTAGTFRCVGELTGEINNYINTAVDSFTEGVWSTIQETFTYLAGILQNGLLDLLIDQNNFWFFFLPLRQVDDYRQNWYWADYLHYVNTGCFTQKLLDNCKDLQAASPDAPATKCLAAYALGYLTHYVADTIGHAYVNRIVESPWRNCWQRHHLVENFIDAYVWADWHDEGPKPVGATADEQTLDTINSGSADPARDCAARLNYARLNDLCNIGSAGLDPILDGTLDEICNLIQQGLFDIKATKVRQLAAPDDPIFTTWAQFIADTIQEAYPPDQVHPSRMGRYPSADDVAGAYGAYRVILSLATEDDVDQPQFPPIAGDLAAIWNQMVNDIKRDVGSVPSPPAPATDQGFSIAALWDAVKAYVKWLGKVAEATLKVVGDVFAAAFEAGGVIAADTIKAGLYLVNSALYSLYHSVRMPLVMSAYSVPFTEDLIAKFGPLDLQTLWNVTNTGTSQRYPIEPVVSERDFGSDSANPFSPYRPYFRPSDLAPVTVESPATSFPQALLNWTSPDDMLDSPVGGTDDMFSAAGPAPATTSPLRNADGGKLTDLETFDGSQRYFGSIFANCTAALAFAVPYISGTPYPDGTVLPDYNLDGDRGFAWPCWDVDYGYKGFPWNGADPFPADTLHRVNTSLIPLLPPSASPIEMIDWGSYQQPNATDPGLRPGLTTNDPWGSPRSGDAWVNATALSSPGKCEYFEFPFPTIIVNPNASSIGKLDICNAGTTNPASPSYNLLTYDYKFAETNLSELLHSDPANPQTPMDDIVGVYLSLPYQDSTTPENDGRLNDLLRAVACTKDPMLILANAVSLAMGAGTTPLTWPPPPYIGSPLPDLSGTDASSALVNAVAQLAVTGRASFEAFATLVPQDIHLIDKVNSLFPNANLDPATLQRTASSVLDTAYTALWAIRANDPGWRGFRTTQDYIAVSGADDTPHRPVNVPTGPYPQYDLSFEVPYPDPEKPGTVPVTTRYMLASAHTFVGLASDDPDDPGKTAFIDPDPDLLKAPAGSFSPTPAPRTVPHDTPSIPDGNKIIIYVHGGGSRAEEAVDMASWLIVQGHYVGHEEYTVISFDLPNSACGCSFDIGAVVGYDANNVPTYDHGQLYILRFEQQYIIEFIEALDQHLGNVKDRIVAVMGGSLGGNMSLLMTDWYACDPQKYSYLQTIVAWSATATASAKYLGIPAADLAAYVGGQEKQIKNVSPNETPDDHDTEVQYIQAMYINPLIPHVPPGSPLYLPPQPIMWYRGGYAPNGDGGWQPCKDQYIAQSRFERYEIYSPASRHWTIAIDLEQITFSFQDQQPRLSVASTPTSNLLLLSGDNDNFSPNAIYDSTIEVARSIRSAARGKAEFWLDTGHSFHNERPHLFAEEIVYFLGNPTAGDSPNGIVVSTVPYADPSMTDR